VTPQSDQDVVNRRKKNAQQQKQQMCTQGHFLLNRWEGSTHRDMLISISCLHRCFIVLAHPTVGAKNLDNGRSVALAPWNVLEKVNSFVLKEEVAAIQVPRNRIYLSLSIHCTVFIKAYYRL
jgi:hypothetical protein